MLFRSHETYLIKKYSNDNCWCYVELYACPCGQEAYLNYNGFSHYSSNEYDHEDGYTHYANMYKCYSCYSILNTEYYVVRDAATCTATYYYSVIVEREDGDEEFEYQRYEKSHNYTYTGKLRDGATTCYDGVIITAVCSDCGDIYENFYAYHYTYVKEKIDLQTTGAACPGYIEAVGCACGYSLGLDFTHAQCDFGEQYITCWIDGYLSGSNPYLNTNSYASYDAYKYVCAVTDSKQCAYTIRYAKYWLKAEDECYAYQYRTYQFGYNEETGEYAYAITLPTGAKMVWHNYDKEDVSDETTGMSGTHYDCPDCGSYYYTENTYRDNYSENRIDSVNTLEYGNMVEYHYLWVSDDSAEDDGRHGRETTYRYVYRDGTESYETDKEYWDYNYVAPFGENSYIYHKSYSSSGKGYSYMEEYGYTYYNDNIYTIYHEYESNGSGYRQDYEYDLDYVAPFGENYMSYVMTHTSNSGESYTRSHAYTWYRGCQYDIFEQTSYTDGSFERYDYTYDVAERTLDDGTVEKYLASCNVITTYTNSNGADEVTENADHRDIMWQTVLYPS